MCAESHWYAFCDHNPAIGDLRFDLVCLAAAYLAIESVKLLVSIWLEYA